MTRFLVAPDSFKGTFEATAVAAAIGAGLRAGGAEAVECPLGDGGEGTAAVLLAARGGEWVAAPAHDPLRRPLEARFAMLGDGETAVVETAAASGLALLDRGRRSPMPGRRSTAEAEERGTATVSGEGDEREDDAELADTFGTGELIVAAVAAGARRVLVGAGGSATTDGGRGALEAIAAGGGASDGRRGTLEAIAAGSGPGGPTLAVLCDVTTPFEDAARVFGPQKGADPGAVARLSSRLDRFAAELPRDLRGVPMTGCAGGLSGGLWAALGAELLPGAEYVMEAAGFGDRLAEADIVITGEGALDSQSFEGKVVGRVAAACAAAGVPLHVLAGRDDLPASPDRDRLASVRETPTLAALEAAARDLASR